MKYDQSGERQMNDIGITLSCPQAAQLDCYDYEGNASSRAAF